MSKEQISTLNQIMEIVDSKASSFKVSQTKLRPAQIMAEKKLILDLIQSALQLANQIIPKPQNAIDDLNRLEKQFYKL